MQSTMMAYAVPDLGRHRTVLQSFAQNVHGGVVRRKVINSKYASPHAQAKPAFYHRLIALLCNLS